MRGQNQAQPWALLRFASVGLIVLALGACNKTSSPPLLVGKLLIDELVVSEGVKLQKAQIRSTLEALLGPKNNPRLDDKGPYVLRISSVTGRIPPEDTGSPVLVLKGTLKARQGQNVSPLEATLEQRGDDMSASPQGLLTQACEALLDRLSTLHQLSQRDTQELIAAIGDTRSWFRLQAISELTRRRDPSSYKALIETLSDKDEAVVLRAVGALVALGDPKAVKALTDLTHRRSPVFVRQIVYAVAAIGGPEAEAYLFTVATGHPDPMVQQAAQAAQAELKKTAPTPQAAPSSPASPSKEHRP